VSAYVITRYSAKYTSKETYIFRKVTYKRDQPTIETYLSNVRNSKGIFRERCNQSAYCRICVKRDINICEKRPIYTPLNLVSDVLFSRVHMLSCGILRNIRQKRPVYTRVKFVSDICVS